MKIYIKSSVGDVRLAKFIFIPTAKVDGVCEDEYVDALSGYLWVWWYTYNTITHQTDAKLCSHSVVIGTLPDALKKLDRILGSVDWYGDHKELFINDKASLTEAQINYIREACDM